MISARMKIKRWQIWLVSFNPARWSEQAWIRPALIIQNNIWNEHSANTIILAISTKQWNSKLDILINPSRSNKLKSKSFVKCNQMLTISKDRLIECYWEIWTNELICIEDSIKLSLWF